MGYVINKCLGLSCGNAAQSYYVIVLCSISILSYLILFICKIWSHIHFHCTIHVQKPFFAVHHVDPKLFVGAVNRTNRHALHNILFALCCREEATWEMKLSLSELHVLPHPTVSSQRFHSCLSVCLCMSRPRNPQLSTYLHSQEGKYSSKELLLSKFRFR